MIHIDYKLTPSDFLPRLERFWHLSGEKINAIEKTFDPAKGAPVFTANGRYTTRGWTEWTQGFQYGSALLQFDATGDHSFLQLGRRHTVDHMATHVSHVGVHDHGFNNVSTYGNLLRLMREGRLEENSWERQFYELALKISGAVQAARWTPIAGGGGFIHSFNGPHSLFVDTIRSCRSLMISHRLNHKPQGEGDAKINLLERALLHLNATARYSIYYGEGRDAYDVSGRTAHESVFNIKDGNYRCPNSQQGYSPFSTWTRGLAWAICGFAEELEFVGTASKDELEPFGGKQKTITMLLQAARATSDFYIANASTDGIPYWDTGAPGLAKLGDYRDRPADPFNSEEPVDSSAAAIACQGLLRLGEVVTSIDKNAGTTYRQAGLTIFNTLLGEPYLSLNTNHQGLILHSIYHRPNGWDHVQPGSSIPNGESSMWGDYHAREAALLVQRLALKQPYYTFFNCVK